MNAWALGKAKDGNHRIDLYEEAPETRRILRQVLAAVRSDLQRVNVTIQPEEENDLPFDGERMIERSLPAWGSRDVILLDPFAMWRQDIDVRRRELYRRIFDRLIERGEDAPVLALFWTWGRAFPIADGDLAGNLMPARNGYQQLRSVLHHADRHFVKITWRWGLQFAMWVIVPSGHVTPLASAVRDRCDQVRDHLVHNGADLRHPNVVVSVD